MKGKNLPILVFHKRSGTEKLKLGKVDLGKMQLSLNLFLSLSISTFQYYNNKEINCVESIFTLFVLFQSL